MLVVNEKVDELVVPEFGGMTLPESDTDQPLGKPGYVVAIAVTADAVAVPYHKLPDFDDA